LPVSTDAPAPDATWNGKIRATIAALPRADAAWKVTAAHDAKNVTLTVTRTGAGTPAAAPKDLHFFSDDSYVAFELPQVVKPNGNGGFVLTLPMAPEADKAAKQLVGVLTSESGWLADGSLRGR